MSDQWAASSSPRRRKGSTLRRVLLILALVLVVVLVGGGLTAANYYRACQGASGSQVDIAFTIPAGATGSDVIQSLQDQGVLHCNLVPRYIVNKRAVTFEAGDYTLQTNMTLDSALAVLAAGPTPAKTVTMVIPEGWRLTQIADRAAKDLGVSGPEVLALAQSGTLSLPPYLPAGSSTAEGFLFPKTYEFVKGKVTPKGVVDTMLKQFGAEAKGLPWAAAKKRHLSPYEVVIIASMIEREAANDAERPKIASVIYNRLRSKTPLYIDATLDYVDPNPADGLTVSDLAMNSPYNTRKVRGLPPTPIASPGRASIKAALKPANTPYVYYVLCGKTHRFTASYSQFLAWKDQCL
jgi:UPF0755 protein